MTSVCWSSGTLTQSLCPCPSRMADMLALMERLECAVSRLEQLSAASRGPPGDCREVNGVNGGRAISWCYYWFCVGPLILPSTFGFQHLSPTSFRSRLLPLGVIITLTRGQQSPGKKVKGCILLLPQIHAGFMHQLKKQSLEVSTHSPQKMIKICASEECNPQPKGRYSFVLMCNYIIEVIITARMSMLS